MQIGLLGFRDYIYKLYKNPKHAKIIHLGKLISLTGSTQILVQALSLCSGILIIRLLPTKEYALYTLVNTMLGTMAILADSGIGDGVLSQGGKVWQDPTKLGSVIATGLKMRRKFAAGSLIVAIPILVYLLLHHGASILMTVLLVLSLIPSFFVALSGSILEMAPKLHQDLFPLQKNTIVLNVGRLALVTLTLFVFPFACLAIFSAGIPQIWANLRLRKISSGYADRSAGPDPQVETAILKIVKRTMPGAIYYCFSAQITTWLISILGSTENLAQVGALGRLTVMLSLFSGIFSAIIIPRIARLKHNRKILLLRFTQIILVAFGLSVLIVFMVSLFPGLVLSVLGKNYASLTREVVIVMLGGCISMMAGIVYNLLLSRAWVIHPAIMIGVNLITQIVLMLSLKLSKMENVLWFSAIGSLVTFLTLSIYFIYRARTDPDHFDEEEQLAVA